MSQIHIKDDVRVKIAPELDELIQAKDEVSGQMSRIQAKDEVRVNIAPELEGIPDLSIETLISLEASTTEMAVNAMKEAEKLVAAAAYFAALKRAAAEPLPLGERLDVQKTEMEEGHVYMWRPQARSAAALVLPKFTASQLSKARSYAAGVKIDGQDVDQVAKDVHSFMQERGGKQYSIGTVTKVLSAFAEHKSTTEAAVDKVLMLKDSTEAGVDKVQMLKDSADNINRAYGVITAGGASGLLLSKIQMSTDPTPDPTVPDGFFF